MILIACGLRREAAILSGDGMIAIPGGGDAAQLEGALEARAAQATIILSCGIAGALDPVLRVGDVVLHLPPFVPSAVEGRAASDAASVSTALDTNGWEAWGDRLRAALPHAHIGTIIGQGHIAASVAEKAALHAQTGALAVDMETHIAARVATRYGLPFSAIRLISDTAHEALPPAALVGMNPDGSMALGKVLASLARDPAQLPMLIRTGRHAEVAFRQLSRVGKTLESLAMQTR